MRSMRGRGGPQQPYLFELRISQVADALGGHLLVFNQRPASLSINRH
jgi:hypothetical protein